MPLRKHIFLLAFLASLASLECFTLARHSNIDCVNVAREGNLEVVTMSRLFSLAKPRSQLSKSLPNQGRPKNWRFRIGKLAFNLSQYNRLGLYSHDVINFYAPIVDEALRRLPKDVLDARNFRGIRAIQLDFMKMHLPKEKWITYEQDLEYRYLEPYIQEIIEERREIYDFGCTNYAEGDWPSGEVK